MGLTGNQIIRHYFLGGKLYIGKLKEESEMMKLLALLIYNLPTFLFPDFRLSP